MIPALRFVRWLAALAAALFSLSALADPPARVGRLSLAEGEVTFRLARGGEGSPATYNWPISSGAILDTGPDGRAEVQVGSSAFRLAGDSSIEFTRVDDGRISLQAVRGSLAVRVRDPEMAGEIEIGTPGGQVRFQSPGRYRVDVDERQGDVWVSSREGAAYISRQGGEMEVLGGQRAAILGNGGRLLDQPSPDDLDAWADARDAAVDDSLARRYVSPQMTGYEDLDRYGQWSSVPEYGAVWLPGAVPADWAPYRYGRWAWVSPWGWTWVDQAPWGFAPFHYGRWLSLGGRWAWVPGAYVQRPVYAPALVAWIGDPGWNAGFGPGTFPAVGWVPLAPREVFIPAYRCSRSYVRRANINHVANAAVIDRAMAHPRSRPAAANRAVSQAVTLAPADLVRRGGQINPARAGRREGRGLEGATANPRTPGHPGIFPAEAARRPRADGTAARQPRQPVPAAVPAIPATVPAPVVIQAPVHPAHRPDPSRPAAPLHGHGAPLTIPIQSLPQPRALPQARELTPAAPISMPAIREISPHPAGTGSRPPAPRMEYHDHGKGPHAR